MFLLSPWVKTRQSHPGACFELKLGVCICLNPRGVNEINKGLHSAHTRTTHTAAGSSGHTCGRRKGGKAKPSSRQTGRLCPLAPSPPALNLSQHQGLFQNGSGSLTAHEGQSQSWQNALCVPCLQLQIVSLGPCAAPGTAAAAGLADGTGRAAATGVADGTGEKTLQGLCPTPWDLR